MRLRARLARAAAPASFTNYNNSEYSEGEAHVISYARNLPLAQGWQPPRVCGGQTSLYV